MLFLLGFTGFIACEEKETTDSVGEEMDTGVISDTGSDDTGSDDTGSETTEGLTCDDVPDCGGDLTGTWSHTGVCGESDFANVQQYKDYQLEKCPQIMNFDSSEQTSGIFTFNEDGSAQYLLSVNVDYSFTWPLSDCTLESGTTTCADLAKGDVHLPPSSVSFECVDGAAEETCDCASVHEHTWELDFSFQTTDNNMTLEDSAGDLSNFEYCVQENTLLSVPTIEGVGVLWTKGD